MTSLFKRLTKSQFIRGVEISRVASVWAGVLLVLLYITLSYLFRSSLPSSAEVLKGFENILAHYGYLIIFLGAFFEAALIIDFLVPGASVVLAGAYFASLGFLNYPFFLLCAEAGFFLGFFVDYCVGFYGWSDILKKLGLGHQLDKAGRKIKQSGGRAFFLGYIHPDLASFFATSAGIIKMDLKVFLTFNFLASVGWLIFWTGLVYIFGTQIQALFENKVFSGVLVLAMIFIMLRIMKKD